MCPAPPPTSNANIPVPTAETSRSVPGITTPTVDNGASQSIQGRDKFGRFKMMSGGKKPRSAEQKIKDKACSNVTKYKKVIVEHIWKIQSIRPDISQTYTVESETKSTLRNPVVCKTIGKSKGTGPGPSHLHDRVDAVAEDNLEDEEVLEIEAPVVHAPSPRTETNRLSDKLCYVCKEKIGPVGSKRIGRSIKDKSLKHSFSFFSVPYQGLLPRCCTS